jgi:DNA-binding NarL/FixJ family response regulator
MKTKLKVKPKITSIGVVDDQAILLEGLAALLNAQQNLQVRFTASDGEEGLRMLGSHPVDVLIMDLNTPMSQGLATVRAIRALYPKLGILVFSGFDEPAHILALRKVGATGYLLKRASSEELLEALCEVSQGRLYFHGSTGRALKKGLSRAPTTNHNGKHPIELTKRETEVMRCIMQGLTTQSMAEELSISIHTVETHRKHLLLKTGSKNSADLVRYAMEHQLMDGA